MREPDRRPSSHRLFSPAPCRRVTVAGTLTQILAEAMAGMAFSQLCRPGAPVVFGTFASSISMQSGAPTFGTPEPALVLYGAAQLARRLGVPFRSGGSLCGSKLPDAQAAHESTNTLVPTVMAGVNFALHSAGWLEGGLVSSYEKFIIDADQCAMMQKFASGVDLSENGQALDAIREVGPGSHFLGCAHTQANFESAFFRSSVADNNSFEQWEAEGGQDAAQRANTIFKRQLKEYQAPEIDPASTRRSTRSSRRRKNPCPTLSPDRADVSHRVWRRQQHVSKIPYGRRVSHRSDGSTLPRKTVCPMFRPILRRAGCS